MHTDEMLSDAMRCDAMRCDAMRCALFVVEVIYCDSG